MKRLILIIIGLWLGLGGLASAAAVPAYAQDGTGTLTGRLVNGTPGGGGVSGQEVTLITYLNNSPLDDTPATLTDADGRFVFYGLDTGPEYGYDAVASYQGVNYWSELPDTGELPSFGEGQTNLEVLINVYDTTADANSLHLMLAHIILSAVEDAVVVTEYYLFATTDNRTYVGQEGDPGVLHFSLPGGADQLQMDYGPDQEQVVPDAGGFWDARPVPPGGTEVGYSYVLSARSGKVDYVRPIDYATNQLDVVVPEANLDVTGPGIVPDESMEIGGSIYAHYLVGALGPGQDLTMVISGFTGGGPSAVWLAVAGLLAVAVVSGIVLVLRRRRPAVVPARSDTAAREHQLLAELAELDDRFDAGEIDEADYKKQRETRKTELARLMRSRRGE